MVKIVFFGGFLGVLFTNKVIFEFEKDNQNYQEILKSVSSIAFGLESGITYKAKFEIYCSYLVGMRSTTNNMNDYSSVYLYYEHTSQNPVSSLNVGLRFALDLCEKKFD